MLSEGGSDLACGWCAAEARVGAVHAEPEVHARVHPVQASGASPSALANPVAHNRVDLGHLWARDDDQRLVRELLLEMRIMKAFVLYSR